MTKKSSHQITHALHSAYLTKLLSKHCNGERLVYEDLEEAWDRVLIEHKQLLKVAEGSGGCGEVDKILKTVEQIHRIQLTAYENAARSYFSSVIKNFTYPPPHLSKEKKEDYTQQCISLMLNQTNSKLTQLNDERAAGEHIGLGGWRVSKKVLEEVLWGPLKLGANKNYSDALKRKLVVLKRGKEKKMAAATNMTTAASTSAIIIENVDNPPVRASASVDVKTSPAINKADAKPTTMTPTLSAIKEKNGKTEENVFKDASTAYNKPPSEKNELKNNTTSENSTIEVAVTSTACTDNIAAMSTTCTNTEEKILNTNSILFAPKTVVSSSNAPVAVKATTIETSTLKIEDKISKMNEKIDSSSKNTLSGKNIIDKTPNAHTSFTPKATKNIDDSLVDEDEDSTDELVSTNTNMPGTNNSAMSEAHVLSEGELVESEDGEITADDVEEEEAETEIDTEDADEDEDEDEEGAVEETKEEPALLQRRKLQMSSSGADIGGVNTSGNTNASVRNRQRKNSEGSLTARRGQHQNQNQNQLLSSGSKRKTRPAGGGRRRKAPRSSGGPGPGNIAAGGGPGPRQNRRGGGGRGRRGGRGGGNSK